MKNSLKVLSISVAFFIAALMALGYSKSSEMQEIDRLSGCFANGKIVVDIDGAKQTLSMSDDITTRVVATKYDQTKAWFGISLNPDIAIDRATGRMTPATGKGFKNRRFIYSATDAPDIEFVDLFEEDLVFERVECQGANVTSAPMPPASPTAH